MERFIGNLNLRLYIILRLAKDLTRNKPPFVYILVIFYFLASKIYNTYNKDNLRLVLKA